MAAIGGFGGTGQGRFEGFENPQERRSQQRDFLDYMRHREPEAWHRFMDRYRGIRFDNLRMSELEGRFRDEIHILQQEQCYNIPAPAVSPRPPKPKTWFEEIQAEVNEWLAGVS